MRLVTQALLWLLAMAGWLLRIWGRSHLGYDRRQGHYYHSVFRCLCLILAKIICVGLIARIAGVGM